MTQSNTSDKSSSLEPGPTIDKPATYNIRVVGFLNANWSDRLGGLKISASIWKGKTVVTTLSGRVVDQAALLGVLNALYALRLPLLSVEYCEISRNYTASVNQKEN